MIAKHIVRKLLRAPGFIGSVVSMFVFVFLVGTASAQQAGSVIQDKASNGPFVGIALVTSNAEWYKLFERAETPSIDGKKSFRPGEKGSIATIFAGAKARDGRVTVECSITAIDVDGSRNVLPSGICYDGPSRPLGMLYPSLLDINFRIGPDDPYGLVSFEIVMLDKNSGRRVKLRVSFLQDTK